MNKAVLDKELVLALRAHGASAVEARELAAVAGALSLGPDPEIDSAFADALEARLMGEPMGTAAPMGVVAPLRPTRSTAPAVPEADRRTIAQVIPLPRRRFTVRKALVAAIAAA